ncbi:hypothetical protein RJ641_011828 [Dillenia turbinata]|uniref:Uncharacterized protein n=1 Tax=Dillenia turbinata TaxID=194707 RepID=A0AAN8V293_9MAGN
MKRLKSRAERTKEEAVSVKDSLEANEALLSRALGENEVLFLTLYKCFSNVLLERLPEASKDGKLRGIQSVQTDAMAVDREDSAAMDVDNEIDPRKGMANNGYENVEKVQWCLSTLGYLKAITRQYASAIWPHVENLDSEILTENVHPLFRKAVYSGLRRPYNVLQSSLIMLAQQYFHF